MECCLYVTNWLVNGLPEFENPFTKVFVKFSDVFLYNTKLSVCMKILQSKIK